MFLAQSSVIWMSNDIIFKQFWSQVSMYTAIDIQLSKKESEYAVSWDGKDEPDA